MIKIKLGCSPRTILDQTAVAFRFDQLPEVQNRNDLSKKVDGVRYAIFAAALAALVPIGTTIGAEEIGRSEFLSACAGCHGKTADGNGPIAQTMSVQAPSLNDLSLRNDGEFPFVEILAVVDGREEVRLHGSPMPIWGERFFTAAAISEDEWEAEIATRGRLLSLVYYLESIQNQ